MTPDERFIERGGGAPNRAPDDAEATRVPGAAAGSATSPPTPGNAPGRKRWGSFTLLESLGSGSSGEVWRAWDSSLQRDVAIKFIHATEGGEADAGRSPLVDEARALARVRHPCVAAVYGLAEFDGRAGMWMEYLRGPSLATRIRERGPVPWRDVARIGRDLCAALEALDHAGLVHRDVKPANVILEADGRTVLADFGLGWRRTLFAVEAPPEAWGTPLFMAPSLLDGGSPTAGTDLYAVGVTLAWALVGRPPYSARTLEELREQAVAGPALEAPGAPSDLVDSIHRAIRDSGSGARYTASKMRAQLDDLLAKQGSAAEAGVAPRDEAAVPTSRPSIAVLPFQNRGGDESDEYFSDGLADELIRVLSKVPGLQVAARASSFRFKGRSEGLAFIGGELGVDRVLEGSVQRLERRVRISLRMVSVPDGLQLWAETYERAFEDLFSMQDEIARSVVTELRGALLGEAGSERVRAKASAQADVAAAVRSRGHDVEAHRLFLLGLHLLERVNEGDTAKGIEYLEQAVDRDPDDALAWAELGRAYSTQVDFGWQPLGEGIVRAREAIERSLAINPEEALAHSKRGWIRMHYERDWRGAEASFRRALELEPGNASVLRSTGALAVCLDRPSEAIEFYLRALESDPLSTAAYNNLGYAYSLVGQRAEAEKALRQSLELAPGRIGTRVQLAFVLQQQGRRQEALDEAMKEPEEIYRLWGLARLHHFEGRRAESRAALAELKERFSQECASQIAQIHALHGEPDEAFEWLERAYRQRDGGLVSVRSTPDFRGLAGDPRWGRFLLKLGFES